MDDKKIKITKTTPGHAHTAFEGTCDKDVTVADIKAEFYHPVFGGRQAWVSGGKWRAIRHDD